MWRQWIGIWTLTKGSIFATGLSRISNAFAWISQRLVTHGYELCRFEGSRLDLLQVFRLVLKKDGPKEREEEIKKTKKKERKRKKERRKDSFLSLFSLFFFAACFPSLFHELKERLAASPSQGLSNFMPLWLARHCFRCRCRFVVSSFRHFVVSSFRSVLAFNTNRTHLSENSENINP